jgi:hypothetical protein
MTPSRRQYVAPFPAALEGLEFESDTESQERIRDLDEIREDITRYMTVKGLLFLNEKIQIFTQRHECLNMEWFERV